EPLLGLGLLGVFYYFVSFAEEGLQTGIAVVALWLVLWLVGRVTGAREERERLRSDRDIAATLAATRQERLDLEAQRTTMAREIHDLVGHTVNVMVVHAGAGRRAVRSDPDGAEQAFATIETTGRAALDELDRVLGLLRSGGVDDGTTPYTPLPGLPETSALLTDFRRAGLSVTMTTEGPVEQVPHSIGLTAYRVVQESLTNAMKHSNATSATVRLAVDDESVVIEVVDPGPAKRPRERVADDGQRSGRGLAGIAERVQLHGGHAEVGPIDGGGFRVICAFPMARSGA
ncbi:MAG: histidine kinase, partial [Actinomycetota bacterium]